MLSGSLAFKKWIVLVTCCDGMIPDQKKKINKLKGRRPYLALLLEGLQSVVSGRPEK